MTVKIAVCIVFLISFSLSESSVLQQAKDIAHLIEIEASQFKNLSNNAEEQSVEPPLFIGSFNIQNLVKKKFNKPEIMYIIQKVILRYDLILILEIQTDADHYMQRLLKDVNSGLLPAQAYGLVLSERKSETKEHYAFLYRKNKLRLIEEESYDDPNVFYRKPLIAIFEAFTLRDMKKFGAVGHHVKPSEAVREIDGLAEVYDYIKGRYEIEDVLLMGDFNADCTYVKESDWDNIALWYRSEFTWAITDKIDTTTNYKSCSLDRFVYAGENMNDGVILSSAGIFDFQQEYMLDVYETRNISDHWPIELKIRGKMSEMAEKHLTADICFRVTDSQERKNITQNTFKLAEKYYFNATKTIDGILLSNETRNEEAMLNALTKLRLGLPSLVSPELVEAVKYKVNYGTLKDDSSFADVYYDRFTIKILSTDELVEAFICRTTSVN